MTSEISEAADRLANAIENRLYEDEIHARLNTLIVALGGIYMFDQSTQAKLLYLLALLTQKTLR